MTDQEKRQLVLPTTEEIKSVQKSMKQKSVFLRIFQSTVNVLLVVSAFAILIATLLFPVAQVSGTSMEPSLYNGDILVLLKTSHFDTGDLVCFTYQNKMLIKRVIAGPGDYVNITSEGVVSVNDVVLDEPYVLDRALGECDLKFPYQVPDERYFLMGDHRSTSIDSRSSVIGSVPKEQIVGRVLFKVWPFGNKDSK